MLGLRNEKLLIRSKKLFELVYVMYWTTSNIVCHSTVFLSKQLIRLVLKLAVVLLSSRNYVYYPR